MTYENAQKILAVIEASRCKGERQDLFLCAARYARIRADWSLYATEDRPHTGAERIAAHEALIDACNILSRAMGRSGEDNTWRRLLGDDRKEIGDFACFLHCILGLRAR